MSERTNERTNADDDMTTCSLVLRASWKISYKLSSTSSSSSSSSFVIVRSSSSSSSFGFVSLQQASKRPRSERPRSERPRSRQAEKQAGRDPEMYACCVFVVYAMVCMLRTTVWLDVCGSVAYADAHAHAHAIMLCICSVRCCVTERLLESEIITDYQRQ